MKRMTLIWGILLIVGIASWVGADEAAQEVEMLVEEALGVEAVTAVTVASSAPLSAIAFKPFLLKNQPAEAKAYLLATKSGLATVSSPIDFANDE